ncbi:MAG: type II secretion system protein [Chthoniobacterales bacterium]
MQGFTLVEVLAATAIVAVLAAVTVPVVGHFQSEGLKAREIAAGRKLTVDSSRSHFKKAFAKEYGCCPCFYGKKYGMEPPPSRLENLRNCGK